MIHKTYIPELDKLLAKMSPEAAKYAVGWFDGV